MSTLYESLTTAGLKPDADDWLKEHMIAVWATIPVHQKMTLEGVNIVITNQQLAAILAVSSETRERLLTPTQLTQWNSMLNEAKVKAASIFKGDPQIAQMRYQCENNAHFIEERIIEDVAGQVEVAPVTQPVFQEEEDMDDDHDQDTGDQD